MNLPALMFLLAGCHWSYSPSVPEAEAAHWSSTTSGTRTRERRRFPRLLDVGGRRYWVVGDELA